MKVYLVGAGPYDKGLMTIKGMEALRQADVIIYDKLVNPAIFACLDCEKIYVGKSAGNHPVPQGEINAMLLRHALDGKNVVRLKGGDPYLFGRGAEELDFLNEHGVPYEVIPGISSAIAVPNYAGIPVTHRDYASSLHIITGRSRQKKSSRGDEADSVYGDERDSANMDFSSLAALDGTLVFLMSVGNLSAICDGLLSEGMAQDTPAAIVENGTSAAQRKFVSDVAHISDIAAKNQVKPPAVLIVGQVCQLSHQYDWFSKLPLSGTKVVVCGHKSTAGKLGALLHAQGCDTVEYPCIDTVAVNQCFIKADKKNYEWLLFTSAQGVKFFFHGLKDIAYDFRGLAKYKFAVIGPETARALLEYGIVADFIPSVYNGEAMGKELVEMGVKSGLIAKGVSGTDHIQRIFQKNGVLNEVINIYDTHYLENLPLSFDNVDYMAFTSASAVHSFAKANEGQNYKKVPAVCIGEMTKGAAEKYGMQAYIPQEATVRSMAELIMEMKKND